MAAWKKVFVAPQSLEFSYGKDYESYDVVRFEDKYFDSVAHYSDLLLTEEFYERFRKYEYVLIYQLDAFVFADRLKWFCDMHIDYVGAPARWGNWKKYHVGNGGFSLRNVSRCLSVVKKKDIIIKSMINECHPINWGEDDFFAYCGWSKRLDFKVPSPQIATTFSVQTDYVRGMRDIKKRGLPFGCHYWTTINYHFWKPYIEKYGYHLSEVQISHSSNTLVNDYVTRLFYLIKRCMRKPYNKQNLSNLFSPNRNFSIWGAGKFGKDCIDLFMNTLQEYKLLHIYDEHVYQLDNPERLIIEKPDINKIMEEDCVLIVTTTKYQHQIKEKLLSNGMLEGRDFFLLVTFYERLYQSLKSK